MSTSDERAIREHPSHWNPEDGKPDPTGGRSAGEMRDPLGDPTRGRFEGSEPDELGDPTRGRTAADS